MCVDVVGNIFRNSVHRTNQQFSKLRLSGHILLTRATCVDVDVACVFVLISILSRRRKKIPNTGNVHTVNSNLLFAILIRKKSKKKT